MLKRKYAPTQPELKMNSLNYEESQPPEDLAGEVSLFYQFLLNACTNGKLPIVPDGCFDLLFCLNPSRPFAVIGNSPVVRCLYHFTTDVQYFGVRFYPGQSIFNFNCSVKELYQHQQLPLFDVLNMDSTVLEKLVLFKNFKERAVWFSMFLKSVKKAADDQLNLTAYCLEQIYASFGKLNLKQLSCDTGYSDRYIRKKFEEYIGFSPKRFCEIIRLQLLIGELQHKNPDVRDYILDQLGFYDPSHFYKFFKKYMLITPNQYKAFLSGQHR